MAYLEASTVINSNESDILNFDILQSCNVNGYVNPGFGGFFTVESLNTMINNTCNDLGGVAYSIEEATITDLGDGTYRYYIRTSDMPNGFGLEQNSWNGNFPIIFNIFLLDSQAPFFIFQYVSNNPEDLTICDECRNITLQACAESYKIVAGLTPATNYFVTIQDRNNDLYIQEITSDGNGDVIIDATSPEFPAGFWLTQSGNKLIKIYSDEALTQIEDITVDTTVYSCVLLNLQYYYTTTT